MCNWSKYQIKFRSKINPDIEKVSKKHTVTFHSMDLYLQMDTIIKKKLNYIFESALTCFFCNKFLIIFHVRCLYQLTSFNLSSISSFQRDLVFLSNKQKVSVRILQLHFVTVGQYPNQQAFYNASTVASMSLQCLHVDNKIIVISKNSYYLSLFSKFQMALCQY